MASTAIAPASPARRRLRPATAMTCARACLAASCRERRRTGVPSSRPVRAASVLGARQAPRPPRPAGRRADDAREGGAGRSGVERASRGQVDRAVDGRDEHEPRAVEHAGSARGAGRAVRADHGDRRARPRSAGARRGIARNPGGIDANRTRARHANVPARPVVAARPRAARAASIAPASRRAPAPRQPPDATVRGQRRRTGAGGGSCSDRRQPACERRQETAARASDARRPA